MTKRDDDSQPDLELGMTTAERRRRRRRGGSLRIPSDNVPRRSSTPVVAPVPEDPSLAMSIAYSFTSDASEPVPRVSLDALGSDVPIEPEFEMKTREMTVVDLEALGLTEPGITTTDPGLPGLVERRISARTGTSEVEIDVAGLEAASDSVPAPIQEPERAMFALAEPNRLTVEPSPDPNSNRGRLNTVALTEEDLEEVREAVRAATGQASLRGAPSTTTPPPPVPLAKNKTQPLSPLDIEEDDKPEAGRDEPEARATAPEVVPELDINEFSEFGNSNTGEIEVDVQLTDDDSKSGPALAPPVDAGRAGSPGNDAAADVPPARSSSTTLSPDVKRSRPPTVPPPLTTGNHSPPPPPPAQHKAPPTPPPKAKESAPAASLQSKAKPAAAPATGRTANDSKLAPRGKPWFVDLFGEDYLRTLPFLTSQATQAEAEFVIDAMGLTPGAHVLDIGCGYGRHAMELAARGFHVVGLDLSKPLLARGEEEAQRRGLPIEFVHGDMREISYEAEFDGAYCLFSTFGYFDDETNKKTITNVARALKPCGRVMIEILNRDYVIADLPTRVWWEGDGCVVLEEVELNYFSSRIAVNRSVVFDDGRQLEQEISVRAYSLHEVGKLMHAAGFRVLEVSGGYHTRGRFFGNQSRHIIVLAERKETAGS